MEVSFVNDTLTLESIDRCANLKYAYPLISLNTLLTFQAMFCPMEHSHEFIQ